MSKQSRAYRKFRKVVRKGIHRKIKSTKLNMTKKEIMCGYLAHITELDPIILLATFSRIFLLFVGVLRIIQGQIPWGIILIVESILLNALDYSTYLWRLKLDKFDENLDENLDSIAIQFEEEFFQIEKEIVDFEKKMREKEEDKKEDVN